MRTVAIIAAGGRGRRFGGPVPKQLLKVGGRPMLQASVEAFVRHPRIDAVVVVLPPDLAEQPPEYLTSSDASAKPVTIVAGGERRQDSVARGFAAVDAQADVILVHDAARPFVPAAVIERVIDEASRSGAAICALQACDTVKVADGPRGARWIERTLARDRVFLAQTPQGFRRSVLADAIRLGQSGGVEATDEAFLAEQAGHRVRLVEGSAVNMKITSAEDLKVAEVLAGLKPRPTDGEGSAMEGSRLAVGTGYDLHRLVEGRPLVIGGVDIPFDRGLLGHSDADVLCHAITDAVLGAAGAGDIGTHFPDSDERWRGASSLDLLAEAVCVIERSGFAVVNVDAVVIAERPKLAPYIEQMVRRLQDALRTATGAVSVKGKTNEGVGELGRGEAIACHAIALLRRNGPR